MFNTLFSEETNTHFPITFLSYSSNLVQNSSKIQMSALRSLSPFCATRTWVFLKHSLDILTLKVTRGFHLEAEVGRLRWHSNLGAADPASTPTDQLHPHQHILCSCHFGLFEGADLDHLRDAQDICIFLLFLWLCVIPHLAHPPRPPPIFWLLKVCLSSSGTEFFLCQDFHSTQCYCLFTFGTWWHRLLEL